MTKTQTTGFTRKLRNFALAAALVATSAGALAAPALADDWHHDRDHDWGYRPYVAVTPGYAYDPYYYPYGYAYAPAPVYASPGVDFVFPIHIR